MTLPAGWRLAAPISFEQAAAHAYRARFRGEAAVTIVAVAAAESDLIPNNRNVNRNGSVDRGVLQINTVHTSVSDAEADDPAQAFAFAWDLSRGGTKFTPWFTFRDGRHVKHLADARRAVKSVENWAGSGPLPAISTAAVSVEGDVSSAVIPQALEELPAAALSIADLRIQGRRAGDVDPGRYITAAALDLSVDEVSQLTLTIADPFGARTWGIYFVHGTDVDLGELRFRVTRHAWQPSTGALEELVVTCLSAPAEALRRADPIGTPHTWPGPIAANEVLFDEATTAGLRFIGEAGPAYSSVTRAGEAADDVTAGVAVKRRNRAQSTYELGLDYAEREGKWFFEAAGVLHFGRPSWLLARLTQFVVRWRIAPGAGYLTPLEAPICSRETNDDHPNRIAGPRTINVSLPRGLADRLRPGMAMTYSGTPGFETKPFTKDSTAPLGYLVTRVGIDLLDEGAPITVEAREAVDPVPEPEEGDPVYEASTAERVGPPAGRSSAGPLALDLVTICLKQVGDRYVFGAEVDLKDLDPDVFDCSELIQWASSQLGVVFVDGSANQIAAVENAGRLITIEKAGRTRGALLWRPGHVALSLGDARTTVEARGRKYGVVEGPFTSSRFTKAGLIPGLDYGHVAA